MDNMDSMGCMDRGAYSNPWSTWSMSSTGRLPPSLVALPILTRSCFREDLYALALPECIPDRP